MVRKYTLYLSLWPLLLGATLFWASGFNQSPSVPEGFSFPHMDKGVHFFVFGLLGTLIVRLPFFWQRRRAGMFLAVLVTSAFGLIDELRQFLNPERSFEWADWVADTLGGMTAIIFYGKWHFYRKILETRLTGVICGRFKKEKS